MINKNWLKEIYTFKGFMGVFMEVLSYGDVEVVVETKNINISFKNDIDKINYCKSRIDKLLKKNKREVYNLTIKGFNIFYNANDFVFLFTMLEGYFRANFKNDSYNKLTKDNLKGHRGFLFVSLKDVERSIWIAFYNAKIEELKGGLKTDFNNLFFDKKESEKFFVYVVEKWLKEEINKTTALRYLFTRMYYKNTEEKTPYKIICTQTYFAREYWNKNFNKVLEKPLNPKNPKLNDLNNSIAYYDKRFQNLLTEFQGG
jgi:hypothetical protein